MRVRRRRLLAACLVAASIGPAVGQPPPAPVQPGAATSALPPSPPPRTGPRNGAPAESGPRWADLTPGQRQVLAPLERDWNTLDRTRREKWLTLAARYPKLSPAEQGRISARMTEWARLSPKERGEVRLRYQESRQVPVPDRNARWQAYQQLPPEQRQQLAERATAAPPPRTPAPPPASPDATAAKSNVVPAPSGPRRPRTVSPALVQSGPGATTRPINRQPEPPAYQPSGSPKVPATPEFVNRSTLLPKRGPQAAGVAVPRTASAPSPSPAPSPATAAPATVTPGAGRTPPPRP